MTREEYLKFLISEFPMGQLQVVNTYENGCTFSRLTEYVETFGILQDLGADEFSISEVVVKRFK